MAASGAHRGNREVPRTSPIPTGGAVTLLLGWHTALRGTRTRCCCCSLQNHSNSNIATARTDSMRLQISLRIKQLLFLTLLLLLLHRWTPSKLSSAHPSQHSTYISRPSTPSPSCYQYISSDYRLEPNTSFWNYWDFLRKNLFQNSHSSESGILFYWSPKYTRLADRINFPQEFLRGRLVWTH